MPPNLKIIFSSCGRPFFKLYDAKRFQIRLGKATLLIWAASRSLLNWYTTRCLRQNNLSTLPQTTLAILSYLTS